MNEIKIAVKNNTASLLNQVKLIAGTSGQPVQVFFDKEWNSFMKYISYKVGPSVMHSEVLTNTITTIPPDVMRAAGLSLEIGITGYSLDGSIIIPTSWCYIGKIQSGATHAPGVGNGGSSDNDGVHIIYDGGVIF